MEIFNFIKKNSILEIEQFIQNGGDVNKKKDKYGYSPLMVALNINNKDKDIIKLLLDNGADVNTISNYGMTPLMVAFNINNKKDKDIIKLLLDNGADVNAQDYDGRTPLLFAVLNNYDKDIIQLLVDTGANDNLETIKDQLKFRGY
jgi:ankyrin repeat protein